MLNRITAAQVCDARDDDSSNAAGKKIISLPQTGKNFLGGFSYLRLEIIGIEISLALVPSITTL